MPLFSTNQPLKMNIHRGSASVSSIAGNDLVNPVVEKVDPGKAVGKAALATGVGSERGDAKLLACGLDNQWPARVTIANATAAGSVDTDNRLIDGLRIDFEAVVEGNDREVAHSPEYLGSGTTISEAPSNGTGQLACLRHLARTADWLNLVSEFDGLRK